MPYDPLLQDANAVNEFFSQIASDPNYDSLLDILKHQTDLSTILDHKKPIRTDFFFLSNLFEWKGYLAELRYLSRFR